MLFASLFTVQNKPDREKWMILPNRQKRNIESETGRERERTYSKTISDFWGAECKSKWHQNETIIKLIWKYSYRCQCDGTCQMVSILCKWIRVLRSNCTILWSFTLASGASAWRCYYWVAHSTIVWCLASGGGVDFIANCPWPCWWWCFFLLFYVVFCTGRPK